MVVSPFEAAILINRFAPYVEAAEHVTDPIQECASLGFQQCLPDPSLSKVARLMIMNVKPTSDAMRRTKHDAIQALMQMERIA